MGDTLWSRFKGGKQGTLWYYRSIADRYLALKAGSLAVELKRVVTRLEELTGEAGGQGRQTETGRPAGALILNATIGSSTRAAACQGGHRL